jgi:hypothetical protein
MKAAETTQATTTRHPRAAAAKTYEEEPVEY